MPRESDGAAREVEPGQSMLGRYEVLAPLGSGGMGTVYLARLAGVAGFQRLFAVKLIHAHVASDPAGVTMLLDEARLAAKLHHPNALGILDVFESHQGYCLVMEYVEGVSLDRIMEREDLDASARVKLGLRALIDAATGLHAAHLLSDEDGRSLGLVHRDVSPQNVMMGTDGSGRIIDFGVARAAQRATATQSNIIKGKPSYMAPEQVFGRDLDARTDVFALGVVAWEVLAGQRLFDADAGVAAIVKRALEDNIPRLGSVVVGIPESLEAVCTRALARDPEDRFRSARQFADSLESAARAADMWLSPRDASDLMKRLFAAELAELRKLRGSTGDTGPVRPGQKVHTPPGSGFRERAPRLEPQQRSRPARSKLVLWACIGAVLLAIAGMSVALRGSEPRASSGVVTAPPPPPAPPVVTPAPPAQQPPAADAPSTGSAPGLTPGAALSGAPQAVDTPPADGPDTLEESKPGGAAPEGSGSKRPDHKSRPHAGHPKQPETLELEINPYD